MPNYSKSSKCGTIELKQFKSLPRLLSISSKIFRKKTRIRREQRSRVESFGENVYWVLDRGGIEKMPILFKSNRMLFFFDVVWEDKICAFDGATLTQIQLRVDPWSRFMKCRSLTDTEVYLFRSLEEFPLFKYGLHKRPLYCYSDAWQSFVLARA